MAMRETGFNRNDDPGRTRRRRHGWKGRPDEAFMMGQGEWCRWVGKGVVALLGIVAFCALFFFLPRQALAFNPTEEIALLCQGYLRSGLAVMTTGDLAPLARYLATEEKERLSGRFLAPSGLCWLWRYYQEDWRSGWKGEPHLDQTFSLPIVVIQKEDALCYLQENLSVSALGVNSGQVRQSQVCIPHALRLHQEADGWKIMADLAAEENVPPGPGMLSGGSSIFPRVAGFPSWEEATGVSIQSFMATAIRPATPSRGAVVTYADQYALNPNTPYYPFLEEGGDCANYLSQCFYEGGWAMDQSSPVEQQWWFHWPGNWTDPFNSSEAWRFAGDYPEGGGLAYIIEQNPPGSTAPNGVCPGRANLHWQELRLGDMVLVHKDEGGHHGGVVVAFDPDHGAPAPYPLVDAHSINRYHYPLDWKGSYSLDQIDVLLLRYPPAQTLVCTPTSIAFLTMEGREPAGGITLALWDLSGGTFHWSAQCDAPWLTFTSSGTVSGFSEGFCFTSASTEALVPGTYSATLTIQAPEAINSPLHLPVSLVVTPATFMDLMILQGWNQVSLAIQTPTSPAQVFANLTEPWFLYRWEPFNGRYLPREEISLQPGVGYWLKPAVGQYPISMSVTGTPLREAEKALDLVQGWNMVGLPYLQPVHWGRVQVRTASASLTLDQAVSAKVLSPPFCWWNGSAYQEVLAGTGLFQKGKGYWIKALLPCQLVFPGPPPP